MEEFERNKEHICGWLRRLWLTKEDADIVANLVKSNEDAEEFVLICDKLAYKSFEEYYEEYKKGNYNQDLKYLFDVCNRLRLLREYHVDRLVSEKKYNN